MLTSSIIKPFSIVATLALATSGALALTHTGGASIGSDAAVKKFDANPVRPILTEETETLAQSGAFVFSHDALFVAVGREVRRYDGRDLSQPAIASWNASSAVKAIADGPERGLVLVLDAAHLTLVRFADGEAPATVWAMAVDESAAGSNPGRILVRDGNRAFVADASIPGVRVVTIDANAAPQTLAVYQSSEGMIQDMSLWGRRVTLATEGGLVVLGVTGDDAPVLTRLGARLGGSHRRASMRTRRTRSSRTART